MLEVANRVGVGRAERLHVRLSSGVALRFKPAVRRGVAGRTQLRILTMWKLEHTVTPQIAKFAKLWHWRKRVIRFAKPMAAIRMDMEWPSCTESDLVKLMREKPYMAA